MNLAYFPLVPRYHSLISEAKAEFADSFLTLGWPFVSVHMIIPLADSFEHLVLSPAVDLAATHDFFVVVSRWLPLRHPFCGFGRVSTF